MSNSKNDIGIIAQEVGSALPDTVTLSDTGTTTITLDYGSTISTVDLTSYVGGSTMISGGQWNPDTITITGSGLSGINGTVFTWNDKPFEDCFPDWNDFQEMCKEYPGLEKAYEHMKVFYKLCKDEWEAKKKGEE